MHGIQVPSDGECLHVQIMGQRSGYLSDCMIQEEHGNTKWWGSRDSPYPATGSPSPQNLSARCTLPAHHSSNQSATARHHSRGWELQNVHFLWSLLVHSQMVHKLRSGFSVNSLSFSQFHPLLFQTEKDHKQLLHKSKLIRFAFWLFLSKSAWCYSPCILMTITVSHASLPRPGGECTKGQNESGSAVICICANQA